MSSPDKCQEQQLILARLKALTADKYAREDSSPCQILEGLFLGSVGGARNKETLKSLNITHVLIVANSLQPHFPDDFVYKKIGVLDTPETNLEKYFNECFHFIDEARQGGGAVLVHCFAGRSRSVTVIIAYLMKHHQMSFSQALSLVKSKRLQIAPNSGFLKQLQNYEKSLGGRDFDSVPERFDVGTSNTSSPLASKPADESTIVSSPVDAVDNRSYDEVLPDQNLAAKKRKLIVCCGLDSSSEGTPMVTPKSPVKGNIGKTVVNSVSSSSETSIDSELKGSIDRLNLRLEDFELQINNRFADVETRMSKLQERIFRFDRLQQVTIPSIDSSSGETYIKRTLNEIIDLARLNFLEISHLSQRIDGFIKETDMVQREENIRSMICCNAFVFTSDGEKFLKEYLGETRANTICNEFKNKV